jgi:phytoene/squalene synthetase
MLAVMRPDAEADVSLYTKMLEEVFPVTNCLREVSENVQKYDRLYIPHESL